MDLRPAPRRGFSVAPRRPGDHYPRLLSQRQPPPIDATPVGVLAVPADLHGPSLARQFTRAYCRTRHLDEVTTDTAVLLVSELVTNAVIHGRGAVRLELTARAGHLLHVEVEDDQDAALVVGDLSTDRQHGRGLAIVASCARAWGVRPVGAGKLVWFEL